MCIYIHGEIWTTFLLSSDFLQPQWEQDLRWGSVYIGRSFASEPEPSETRVSPAVYVQRCTLRYCGVVPWFKLVYKLERTYILIYIHACGNRFIYLCVIICIDEDFLSPLPFSPFLFSYILQPQLERDWRCGSICIGRSFASEPESSGAKVSPTICFKRCTCTDSWVMVMGTPYLNLCVPTNSTSAVWIWWLVLVEALQVLQLKLLNNKTLNSQWITLVICTVGQAKEELLCAMAERLFSVIVCCLTIGTSLVIVCKQKHITNNEVQWYLGFLNIGVVLQTKDGTHDT